MENYKAKETGRNEIWLNENETNNFLIKFTSSTGRWADGHKNMLACFLAVKKQELD